jgi:hypothetical protein
MLFPVKVMIHKIEHYFDVSFDPAQLSKHLIADPFVAALNLKHVSRLARAVAKRRPDGGVRNRA